jgi:hypothetical protein
MAKTTMYHRYFGPLIGCPAFVAYMNNEVTNPCNYSIWLIPMLPGHEPE